MSLVDLPEPVVGRIEHPQLAGLDVVGVDPDGLEPGPELGGRLLARGGLLGLPDGRFADPLRDEVVELVERNAEGAGFTEGGADRCHPTRQMV